MMKTTDRHSFTRASALVSATLLLTIAPGMSAAVQVKIEGEGLITYTDFPDQVSEIQPYSFSLVYDSETPGGSLEDPSDLSVYHGAIKSFSYRTGVYEWTLRDDPGGLEWSYIDVGDNEGVADLLGFRILARGPSMFGCCDANGIREYGVLSFGAGLRFPTDQFDGIDLPTTLDEASWLSGGASMSFNSRFSYPYFSGSLTSIAISAIPEPGEWAFLSAGLLGVMAALRRKAKRHPR